MKHLLAVIFILFALKSNAQTKIYTDTLISQILQKESLKIAAKIYEAASKGKIKVYWNDSLKNGSFAKADNIPGANEVNGLSVVFKTDENIESSSRNIKLAAVAPMYNPMIGGIELPKMAMFYVLLSDLEKIISANDKKFIVTIGNLLYSTHNFYREFRLDGDQEAQMQNINEFIYRNIYDNMNSFSQKVYFTEEHLNHLSTQLIQKMGSSFQNKITNKKTNTYSNFDGIFEDIELKKQYTANRWSELNDLEENIQFADPENVEIIHDTVIYTPLDFYNLNKLIVTPAAIGMSYDYPYEINKKAQLYASRRIFIASMPNWLGFIVQNYL